MLLLSGNLSEPFMFKLRGGELLWRCKQRRPKIANARKSTSAFPGSAFAFFRVFRGQSFLSDPLVCFAGF